MKLILSTTNNPYFNLATEEYLFNNFTEEYVFLYINAPSVIIGRNQVAYAEVDYSFLDENNIPLIRRISGGGTVFHDTGNLNYSFITNNGSSKIDYLKSAQPIISFFKKFNIDVNLSTTNSLTINELKVSGMAQHVSKGRMVFHGTLLFNSNIEMLTQAITNPLGGYSNKAIQSNRANVCNLSELDVFKAISIYQFQQLLFDFLISFYPDIEIENLSEVGVGHIQELVETKYLKESWNIQKSPPYQLRRVVGNADIAVDVRNGVMQMIAFKNLAESSNTEDLLTQQLHNYKYVKEILRANNLSNTDIQKILKMIF